MPGSALVLRLSVINVSAYTTAAGAVPISVELSGSAGQQQMSGSIYVPQLAPGQGKTVNWTSSENLLGYQGSVSGTATSTSDSVASFSFFLPLPSTATSSGTSSGTSGGTSSASGGTYLAAQYQAQYQDIQNQIDNYGAQLDALEVQLQDQGVAPDQLQYNTQVKAFSSQIESLRQQKLSLIASAQAQGISL